MSVFDVIVVGSLNLDLVVGTERLPGPGETVSGHSYSEFAGGKGLNQAVSAARMGATVAFVGALGSDHAGDTLRAVVRDEQIDDMYLETVDREATGRALISVDDSGENSIIVVAGANGGISVRDLPQARVVLAQLETNTAAVESAFRIARDRGAITILNPAPAVPLEPSLVSLVDVLVPNEHELALLGGRDAVLGLGAGELVVTRGSAGVDLVGADDVFHVNPFPVVPVDTTGAGDAFCGALACSLAQGTDMRAALRIAAAAGALATTRHGAVPSQPTRSEVLALCAIES